MVTLSVSKVFAMWCEELGSDLQHSGKKLGVEVHAYNPSNR